VARAKLGSPVLFRQKRPGQSGQIFELIKFRTMTDAQDSNGNLLPDDERLTSFGRRLRRLSLDELPTLWNVIRGDMSLVGPRPLLVQYLDRYTPEQSRRHEVAPGITGWAQINGRNAITWEEKFELDVWYVENVSLRTDLAILFRTVVQVLAQRDISAEEHATMPEFMGSHEESAQ
jgi:lipopolysaccharide/colanic/teichoic acid biosynthesis glycosyltransferase